MIFKNFQVKWVQLVKKLNFNIYQGIRGDYNKKNKKFIYIGEKIGEKKTGFGLQKWDDGSKFIGNFSENKANGFCIFKNKFGNIFKGKI